MGDSLSEQEGVYHNVIEPLFQTFGEVLSRDVICAVVESCGGDMDQSANAIMNMTNDKEIQESGLHDYHDAEEQTSLEVNNIDRSGYQQSTASNNQHTKQHGWSQNNEQPSGPHSYKGSVENTARTNVSYSGAAQSVSKSNRYTNNRLNDFPRSDLDFWTSQTKQILMHHNKGSRILIIMRGAPGSGKTHLAKKILEATIGGDIVDYKSHIFSTDDYFLVNGFYQFDKMKLTDAHIWNQTKARSAMCQGLSPVIIDNTNIELWEMEPYIRDGVNNGYLIEIVEPNTYWAKRANQLARKNIHGVPVHTIRRMLDNFQNGVTAVSLLQYYKLSYPVNMKPPILRNFPIIPVQTDPIEKPNHNTNVVSVVQLKDDNYNFVPKNVTGQNEEMISNVTACSSADEQIKDKPYNDNNSLNAKHESRKQYQLDNNLEQHTESQMQLDEFEQIDEAWETNEKWEDDLAESDRKYDKKDLINESLENSKPPREKFKKRSEESKPNVQHFLNKCQDWTKIDIFMQPWDNDVKSEEEKPVIVVEKVSSSTSMEPDDMNLCNINKAYKILCAVPRDINFYYMPLNKEKIPEKRMLDKSSMINEQVLAEAFRGEDEKEQFTLFRNMFKNVKKSDLRSVFDSCYGDVHWATTIMLEGIANDEFPMLKSDDSSDSDEEIQSPDEKIPKDCARCDHYVNNIISSDDSKPSTSVKANQFSEDTINNISSYDNSKPSTSANADHAENMTGNVTPIARKGKKANKSNYLNNLKRQIEESVVISENHYSKHCLKIRNQRQGIRSEVAADVSDNPEDLNTENVEAPNSNQIIDNELPSTSKDDMVIHVHHDTDDFDNDSDSDDSENINFALSEKTVNINLSWDFIGKLDEYFGRDEMVYPEHVTPIINIPQSLLTEINALWMESFMDQFEAKSRETQLMIEQDEAIARELEKQELELYAASEAASESASEAASESASEAASESASEAANDIPDFKTIMDIELALSLYKKNVAEWRKREPTDLAARLTREKLRNLFPEINQDVLSELLMAHNNNFYHTVEGLLISTGQAEILAKENGLRDFVIAKGSERRERLREEHKKELSQSEQVFLPRPGEKVDMQTVETYRKEADMHLSDRNKNYQKARDCVTKGLPLVASYYSEIAAMHTQKYEYANSMAASTLIQVGTYKNSYTATIDLHHLRVREAKEGLDLFIDMNINRLREVQRARRTKYTTLYFITGRGLHSPGLPKIKPAVQKRLKERRISFKERNPGLLMAKIYPRHKMTHEVA